jgi:hypothetical protein
MTTRSHANVVVPKVLSTKKTVSDGDDSRPRRL